MKDQFLLNKKNFLSKKDKSRKGGIDSDIKGIVDYINSLDDYYTTSSCSGRITLLELSASGKKGSRWLLCSHGEVSAHQACSALEAAGSSDVWFIMETWILHVCCRDGNAAARLLKLCQGSGLKRTGITSFGSRFVVEILSTDSISSPVAEDGRVIASPDYLSFLVRKANARLRQCRKRLKLFESLLKSFL